MLKTTSATIALFALSVSLAGQAQAAGCASPAEAAALKTAVVQQELMVAALTCDQAGAYNSFVISHRSELQDSDAALKSYFHRASARGEDEYNAYKTALANGYSLVSLRGQGDFCREAQTAFEAAYDSRSLAEFISEAPPSAADKYPACESRNGDTELVTGGSSARRSRHAS